MRPHVRLWMGTLLAGLLLAILACNGGTGPATPSPPELPTATKTPTPMPPTNTPSPPPPTSTPTPTPEPRWAPEDLQQPDNLDSYRSTLSVSWTGTATDGEEISGSIEMDINFVREPLAQHVSISGDYPPLEELGVPRGQTLDLYLVDGAVYTNLFGNWLTRPAEDAALTAFTGMPMVVSDELLKGLAHATYRGRELRNGIDTVHFGLDRSSFQFAEQQGAFVEDGSGEVYVAAEGNYPVSLGVVLSGVNLDIPADTDGQILSDGTVEVAFDLSSIDEAFEVKLPEEALAADSLPAVSPDPLLFADIPVPEHAANLTTSPLGLTTYQSPRSWEALALHYRDGMPRHGWREMQVEQASEVTILVFSKDSRTTTITIAPDKNMAGSAVWIAVRSE